MFVGRLCLISLIITTVFRFINTCGIGSTPLQRARASVQVTAFIFYGFLSSSSRLLSPLFIFSTSPTPLASLLRLFFLLYSSSVTTPPASSTSYAAG